MCGTCMDARGIGDAEIIEGARRSTMDELIRCETQAEVMNIKGDRGLARQAVAWLDLDKVVGRDLPVVPPAA